MNETTTSVAPWGTIGSLFSGVLGLDLGLERAGVGRTVWTVEKDPYCRRVIAARRPEIEQHEDVCDVGTSNLSRVWCLCGGFPCQGNSSAGKGLGLADPRSGLWREFRRIAEELTPACVVVENVASGARRWLPFVRRDLHLLGYRTRALGISAFDVGAPHMRRRVFLLAAHPERVELRDESRWRGGSNGEGAPVVADAGSHGAAVSDTARLGRVSGRRGATPARHVARPDTETGGPVLRRSASRWRWERRDDGQWTPLTPVSGVAHGVPRGVDRNRVMGNAVSPDCGEVAGRVLMSEVRHAA